MHYALRTMYYVMSSSDRQSSVAAARPWFSLGEFFVCLESAAGLVGDTVVP